MTIHSDGQVGIGTTNPLADLHIEGSVKVGSSGTIFNEIRHIHGTFDSGEHHKTFTLPAGYNETNTRILNLEVKFNNRDWVSLGFRYGDETLKYALKDSFLSIYAPSSNYFKGASYRILLLKF